MCAAFGAPPDSLTVYLGSNTVYKAGIVGNAQNTVLSSQLSLDPLYPTDFSYAMGTLQASNIASDAPAPFYYRDPTNVVNENTYTYGKSLTVSTNPRVDIQRTTVNNLSVINDSASSLASPFDVILQSGVYTLTQPWYNYISRDLYIRAENNSVVTQQVKGIQFLPAFTALGATHTTQYSLQVNIGTGQPMIAATGSAVRFLPPFSIVSGLTNSNGISSGFDGNIGGTGGLMNTLMGGHEVVGISGQYFTMSVQNEGGLSFANLLNQTFTNYINAVDVYRVTVHTTSPNGALFTDRNTRTYLGDWTVNGIASDGIAFINHSVTSALNDNSMTPYISGGAYSNTIAVQTNGGQVKAKGCMFINYPVASHAYNGGTITLGHCTVSGSYYGFALDSGSNGLVAGSIFSRCAFPIIADGASSLKITHDLTNIGKTHIVGNRSPAVTIVNGSMEIGSTNIVGPGIFGVNASVAIKPFTNILSAKGTTGGTGQSTASSDNKFAFLGINTNVTSPSMGSSGVSGTDPVTNFTTAKFGGSGSVQFINSRGIMSNDKTSFTFTVDTDKTLDSIKGLT